MLCTRLACHYVRALLCSELAIRDGRVRELREERDAVMASVRQRDSALQVGRAPLRLIVADKFTYDAETPRSQTYLPTQSRDCMIEGGISERLHFTLAFRALNEGSLALCLDSRALTACVAARCRWPDPSATCCVMYFVGKSRMSATHVVRGADH